MRAVRSSELLRFLPIAPPSAVYGGFGEEISEVVAWTPPPSPPGARQGPASAPLAALAGGALAHRFHAWRGRSGRRYVFSVFDVKDCPDYAGAVVAAVARDGDGTRRILALRPVDEAETWHVPKAAAEIHVHLPADSGCERASAMADLCAAFLS